MEILVKLLQACLPDAQENVLINKIRQIYEFIWIYMNFFYILIYLLWILFSSIETILPTEHFIYKDDKNIQYLNIWNTYKTWNLNLNFMHIFSLIWIINILIINFYLV